MRDLLQQVAVRLTTCGSDYEHHLLAGAPRAPSLSPSVLLVASLLLSLGLG